MAFRKNKQTKKQIGVKSLKKIRILTENFIKHRVKLNKIFLNKNNINMGA